MFKTIQDGDLLPRRVARIAFGSVLLVGAVMVVMGWRADPKRGASAMVGIETWQLFVVTWLTAFAAGACARMVTPRRYGVGDRLLLPSLLLPGAGIAMLLPLTLHMPFLEMLIPFGSNNGTFAERFDDWADASIVIVGHVHLVLALLVAIRARGLVRHADEDAALSPGAIYGLTLLSSCFPGIIYFALPPIYVAMTGIPFLPLLHHMKGIVVRERAVACELPVARVVAA